MRIVFMGTPAFAVPSLAALVASNFAVVAVVTAPDRPAGRGQQTHASPVKAFAQAQGIPVLQPDKLRDPGFLEALRGYAADLQVVVAFRMLPEVVWAMPARGTVNLHASLLPRYRGAAPINWAIIHGETQTGVTTFFLQADIDTGPLIFQESQPILPTDDAGTLAQRLMHQGAAMVVRTAHAIADGTAPRMPQPTDHPVSHAPKLFKETCQIDWRQPAAAVHNFVRGLAPEPAAWTMALDNVLKIFITEPTDYQLYEEPDPGAFVVVDQRNLYFRAADGWLAVRELQAQGKKRMPTADFLRGNRL